MDLIVKQASALSPEEQTALGITGIPQAWPIESFPYSGTVPTGFTQMTDVEMQAIKDNNQAAYDAWAESKRPIITPVSPVQDVRSVGTKNSHTMQSCGAVKGQFTSSNQGASITLSNKSVDGFTFTYSSAIVPRIGDYVFQDNFCNRAWITAVDTVASTVTFDHETVRPSLSEGVSHYSKGYYIDTDIPDWFSPMYLWGLTTKCFWSGSHDGRNDLVELSIVDTNDMFKDDGICGAVFGCTAAEADVMLRATGWDLNGEYGHWTKYYDESMVVNISGRTFMTPDGAPGQVLPHLVCRIAYFTSLTDSTLNEIFLDYFFTAEI